jgi:hypothetical protein
MSTQTDYQNGHQIAPRIAAPARVSQATAVEQSRAVAEVEAAIVVAMRYPRNVAVAVEAMREACKQKALAEKAFFRFPRGGTAVSGASIHLARELARVWGNFQYGISELDRDDENGKSEMLAFAWDVQTNTRNSSSFINPHMRDKRGGPERLTDMRDIYESNANSGARRVRETIFASLPTWFVEEAKDICSQTLADGGGKPLAQRVADATGKFGQMGITPRQLEDKIGRPSDKWIDQDVAQLSVIFKSLVRGEITRDEEFPPERVTAADITGRPAPVVVPPAAPEPAGTPVASEVPPTEDTAGPATNAASVPGSASSAAVDEIRRFFSERCGFTRDDRAQMRQACEQIAGRKLVGGTIGNLSAGEAAVIIHELGGVEDRAGLVALLAEKAAGQ